MVTCGLVLPLFSFFRLPSKPASGVAGGGGGGGGVGCPCTPTFSGKRHGAKPWQIPQIMNLLAWGACDSKIDGRADQPTDRQEGGMAWRRVEGRGYFTYHFSSLLSNISFHGLKGFIRYSSQNIVLLYYLT